MELTKRLPVHFYIVSETEKLTTTNYVDITQSVHATFVDKTFHVYLNKFFFSYSICCGSVEIAGTKLRHGRSVWGSLLHTSPTLCYILHAIGGESPNAQFLKRWSLLF